MDVEPQGTYYKHTKIKLKQHLWKSILKCFLKLLWLHKKVCKNSFTGDDWPLSYVLLCTITVLICQAKSMKANETSNKHLKLALSSILKLI